MTVSPPEGAAPAFSMKTHYIKDCSFENPHAPHSFAQLKDAPKIDLNVDLVGQQLGEDMYELTMVFSVRASAEKTLFIVDLSYAGVFEVTGVAEEHIQPVLLVDCAFLLYPFARRVMADLTRDGGYPPLLLEPVDFVRLYRQRVESENAE